MERKLIMYTMSSCGYCKKMKEELNKQEFEYIEWDYKEHNEEWNRVKALTKSGVFPTFVFGNDILIPNRDFKSPQELMGLVQHLDSLPHQENDFQTLTELNKNLIFMVKNLSMKVDELIENQKRSNQGVSNDLKKQMELRKQQYQKKVVDNIKKQQNNLTN